MPRCHRSPVEAEHLQLAQRTGGEPIAAALVAREHGLVNEHHLAPSAGQGGSDGRTRRATADHGYVDAVHADEGTAGSLGRPTAEPKPPVP